MQKRERNLARAVAQRGRKNFASIFLVMCSKLRDVRVDFLSIKAAVADREELRRLAAFDRRNCYAVEIAFVVESGVVQEFRVLRIDLLWLRHPIAECGKKWRAAKLRDVSEHDRVGVGRNKRKRAFSRVTEIASEVMTQGQCASGGKRENGNQSNPNTSIHRSFIFLQSVGNWYE